MSIIKEGMPMRNVAQILLLLVGLTSGLVGCMAPIPMAEKTAGVVLPATSVADSNGKKAATAAGASEPSQALVVLTEAAAAVPAEATAAAIVEPPAVQLLGYSIQVGAFSRQDNAERLAQQLSDAGCDAQAVETDAGLYRVRFGDYPSAATARAEAERLQRQDLIADFYVVAPQTAPLLRQPEPVLGLRHELVVTAQRFLGTPYRYGGMSEKNGFDCSGLTLTAYRLNGLELPRSSGEQYRVGRPVPRAQLRPGDLVFFAISGSRISHVGIYVGDGRFIHAPRRGKPVAVSRLDDNYYRKRYVGARTYL